MTDEATKLCPRETTEAMVEAAYEAGLRGVDDTDDDGSETSARAIWQAMYDAAPDLSREAPAAEAPQHQHKPGDILCRQCDYEQSNAAPSPAPADGLVERLREFDSYRGRLSFDELKTLDEACAALASRPPPIVSGDEAHKAWADSPCPNCSSRYHSQRMAPLSAVSGRRSAIRHCYNCGEEWEDQRTFDARAQLPAAIAQTKERT